jgi:hypothetical protein
MPNCGKLDLLGASSIYAHRNFPYAVFCIFTAKSPYDK